MNRIILIGNGFDLAHGLKTRYIDFLNWYWRKFIEELRAEISTKNSHKKEDKFVRVSLNGELHDESTGELSVPFKKLTECTSYEEVKPFIQSTYSNADKVMVTFSNNFWRHICEKSSLTTWLDIENEYYDRLKSYLNTVDRNNYVQRLNKELCEVKGLLERYLSEVCVAELSRIKPNHLINEILFLKNGIKRKSVALSKQPAFAESAPKYKKKLLELTQDFVKKENEQSEQKEIQAMLTGTPYRRSPLCDMSEEELDSEAEQSIERTGIDPEGMLVLNFNYTPTFEKLYAPLAELEIVNIHGELNNPDNPIVFGYGDELDDGYKEIEKTNDNDFLDNIKSVAYGNTDNYRRLLEFLQLGAYQVFVMGHSCGNSDRTLLNEIFEHPNCASVKLFYHDRGDGSDDFSSVYKNITRNFNNKKSLRDIVVNKTYCKPLPQSGKIDS